jgi:hypothetical protein
MTSTKTITINDERALCPNCGIPADAQYFDESGTDSPPGPGGEVVLARFTLHPQYCGVLTSFSQFSDAFARDQSQIDTEGLAWIILSNRRPLSPYLQLTRIMNPWGFGSFEFAIRLDAGATIEFVVRGLRNINQSGLINKVGGRIMGRYWYNPAYGNVERRRS